VNVLASDQYQWFWWIAPILFLSILLVIALLSGEYIRRVLIPRTKGRRVE
jgi:ABC-type dipeptide/oligopeptide/nickel transport system permease subunit